LPDTPVQLAARHARCAISLPDAPARPIRISTWHPTFNRRALYTRKMAAPFARRVSSPSRLLDPSPSPQIITRVFGPNAARDPFEEPPMPHFADPEDRHPPEVDLPREVESPRVTADDDANNVFFNQVVARPKPPVEEPPATRERLVEVETAAEEARLLAQRAAADLYDAAAQVELARAPLADATRIQRECADDLEAAAQRLSHAQVENERLVKTTGTNSSTAWDARRDEADAVAATDAKMEAAERMRRASETVKKAEEFVNESTVNLERQRAADEAAVQASFDAIDAANELAASMDAVDQALMEADSRHKDAVRMTLECNEQLRLSRDAKDSDGVAEASSAIAAWQRELDLSKNALDRARKAQADLLARTEEAVAAAEAAEEEKNEASQRAKGAEVKLTAARDLLGKARQNFREAMAAASAKKTEVRVVEERRETAVETKIRVQAAAITARSAFEHALTRKLWADDRLDEESDRAEMLALKRDMAQSISQQSEQRAKALKKEALAYAKRVLEVEAAREAEAEEEARLAREQAAAVAKESEERAKARREEAWELVARLAEAEAAAEEAASREFEARKTAKVAKDELASIAEFEPVTSASKREEAKRLAEQLAYAEAVAEAERLVEEERVRILQMQEAAKQNRAKTVGEARRLVSEQYGVATLSNNAKAFNASAKEASPSWLLWE